MIIILLVAAAISASSKVIRGSKLLHVISFRPFREMP